MFHTHIQFILKTIPSEHHCHGFTGSNGSHDEEKLTSFLEEMMGQGLVQDGTVATESVKLRVRIDSVQ